MPANHAPITMPAKVTEMKLAFIAGVDQPMPISAASTRALQIDLESIEKHAAADQAKHSIMETGRGKAIEPRAGVDCLHGTSQGAVFLSGQVFGQLILSGPVTPREGA